MPHGEAGQAGNGACIEPVLKLHTMTQPLDSNIQRVSLWLIRIVHLLRAAMDRIRDAHRKRLNPARLKAFIPCLPDSFDPMPRLFP